MSEQEKINTCFAFYILSETLEEFEKLLRQWSGKSVLVELLPEKVSEILEMPYEVHFLSVGKNN